MKNKHLILPLTFMLCAACAKPAKEPPAAPQAEQETPASSKDPAEPFVSVRDYYTWAQETGYGSGTLLSEGMDGIGEDRYITLPGTPAYESGRIIIGDSRCVQLGIYQQRSGGSDFAAFGLWGGRYREIDPFIPDETFRKRVENCFKAQVAANGNCDISFFATVNDYDFLQNKNTENIRAALRWAERVASMRCEYQGVQVAPHVTVIGIAAGAREGTIAGYPAEEFNSCEEAYNRKLKEAVAGSEILSEAGFTTVPEILSDRVGFLEDGIHYDDDTLKRLAEYISR